MNFNDGRRVMCEKGDYVNNALVEVDLASGSVAVVRGVDVASLAAVNAPDKNFLLACFRNEKRVAIFDDGGSVFGEAMPKRWVCPKTDLDGADRRKLLRYALIETEHDLIDIRIGRTGTHKICQRLRQAAKGALQRDGQRFQAVS